MIDQKELESLIRSIVTEKLGSYNDTNKEVLKSGIIKVNTNKTTICENDRLDTGIQSHHVYTRDVLNLEESKNLGCGIMEMKDTTFDWHLTYDEIDYIIDGKLTIVSENSSVTASAGEIIFIPKGSKIKFSVEGFARFMYVTYPADWAN